MPTSNAEYVRRTSELESRVPKAPLPPAGVTEAKVRFYLQVYRSLRGRDLPPNATVLDYGCSFGSVVDVLWRAGYDAWGVDILEYWGKDRELCGRPVVAYAPEVTSRLIAVDPDNIRLPFDNRSIDMIVSDQVLEHVFDFEPIFREHARVLKPDGLAVHRFPRRYAPLEVHTGLPFAPMSRYRWYLALWAMTGYRTPRQQGLSWCDTVLTNQAVFQTTNYVPKKHLLDCARRSGLGAQFLNHLPISESRIGRLYRRLDRVGLAKPTGPLMMAVNMNHTLILESPDRPQSRRS
jgi:SAM-dependent methyltransferase